jgi:hypothetical protein
MSGVCRRLRQQVQVQTVAFSPSLYLVIPLLGLVFHFFYNL